MFQCYCNVGSCREDGDISLSKVQCVEDGVSDCIVLQQQMKGGPVTALALDEVAGLHYIH